MSNSLQKSIGLDRVKFVNAIFLVLESYPILPIFQAIEILNSCGTSLDAATIATAILEDSELTNAGYGSNLTFTGDVECDASVMNGSDRNFGAVGAVSGVKNPVCLAKKICCNQNEKMKLGRIPPWCGYFRLIVFDIIMLISCPLKLFIFHILV